jgi:hypothetical protein
MVVALDRLQAMAPKVESVSLVVAWFGDDLRAGHCKIAGRRGAREGDQPALWSVNGVGRTACYVVSTDAEGRPVYGGTPADFAVVQAIKEMKARGLRVTFYPFILMDVPPGNTCRTPTATTQRIGPAAFPWRGRITCSPARASPAAPTRRPRRPRRSRLLRQRYRPASFAVSGESVSWTGPSRRLGPAPDDPALRASLRGGGRRRRLPDRLGDARADHHPQRGVSSYPAVQAFRDLAADCARILGPGTKLSYAADWSEYFGHQPGDGRATCSSTSTRSGPMPNTDFIGIDNYMPLSDWRDGFDHLDAQAGPRSTTGATCRRTSRAARASTGSMRRGGPRGAGPHADHRRRAGKPWVFRYKDLRAWWSEPHFNRPGGVESGNAHRMGAAVEADLVHRAGLPRHRPRHEPAERVLRPEELGELHCRTSRAAGATTRSSAPISRRRISGGAIRRTTRSPPSTAAGWCMCRNAPPGPGTRGPIRSSPRSTGVWTDGPNWRLGHWLTGRLGAVSLAALVRHLCLRPGCPSEPHRRLRPLGRGRGLHDHRAGEPARLDHHARTALRLRRRRERRRIRFVMRERGPLSRNWVPTTWCRPGPRGEGLELTRAQETELPQALKWQLARADEDYDAAQVEAQRITVSAAASPRKPSRWRCRRRRPSAAAGAR